MPARVYQPLIEVYLLVEQPRQRLSHWSQALAPLDGADAPPLAAVDAYYDPSSNQAIFGLRYDEVALGPDRLRLLGEVATLAEIGMIQAAELSEGDRRRFVGERLASCTVHVGDQRTIVGALVELVRRVRGQKQPSRAASAPLHEGTGQLVQRTPETRAPAVRARGDTEDPVLLVAKGTRKVGAVEPELARSTRDVEPGSRVARGSTSQPRLERETAELEAEAVPRGELKQVISEPITATARRLASALSTRRHDTLRPSPNVLPRAGVHRANTVMLSSQETQRMIEAANHAANQAEAEREAKVLDAQPDTEETDAPTEPFLPDRDRAPGERDDLRALPAQRPLGADPDRVAVAQGRVAVDRRAAAGR